MPGTAQSGGNRQKTRQQHELDGTFRKDRHGDLKTPEPPAGRPKTPHGLTSVEVEEWERMMVRLELSQSLWTVDDGAVYQYCRLFAETEAVSVQQVAAVTALAVLDSSISDVKGIHLIRLFEQILVLRKLIAKGTDQLRAGRMAIRQYLVEFGLTPASRGRVKLPSQEAETDEFVAFQQKPRLSRVK